MKSNEPTEDRYDYTVTVIVPAYNEGRRISRTLEAINHHFQGKPLTREIIVVDDGSTDDTIPVVEDLKKKIDDLTLITYHPNRGKGFAIKQAVEKGRGEYILFTDADNSTPIEEFDKFYPLLQDNEVVIGSRHMPGSHIVVTQPKYRVVIGRTGNRLIQYFLLKGINDTQCGFKAFQHEAARQIFGRMKVNRFGFDIEILSIARLLHFSIREVPVNWYHSSESRLRPVKDILRTFAELIYVKINLWRGTYR